MGEVLIWGKGAYFGKWIFSDFKNVSNISSGFFVCKIGKKNSRLSNLKKRKLPKKPQIQSCTKQFFKNNKK